MNKTIKILLSIMLLLTTMFSSRIEAKANNEIEVNSSNDILINDLSKYNTYEKPMPKVEGNSTKELLEMENWKAETKNYLEKFYNQSIVNIKEDSEKVVFYFQTKQLCDVEQVEEVAYYKENSETRANVGDVKLTTYSAWSNGAVPVDVDFKTVSNFLAVGSIVIGLCNWSSQLLSAFISSVATYTGWTIDNSLPIQSESRAAIKYMRKMGNYYLNTGVWLPNVIVGRAESWYFKTCYQPTYKNGPYIPHHYDNVPNAAETNYSNSETKAHYTDHIWILNKARELANSGQFYIDYFG